MMRAMFSAVAGLRAHQTGMDVIGNNIANVNTIGFKESRVTFSELLNQTVRSAAAPQGGRGGMNPLQVGMGVSVGSIDVIHRPGNRQDTGRATDLAIAGDGFFVVADGEKSYYTRAAIFGLDKQGNLVSSNGMKVMGWYDRRPDGSIDDQRDPVPIKVSISERFPAMATGNVSFTSNLDARVASGSDAVFTSTTVYDSQGKPHDVFVTFTKTDVNTWEWKATTKPTGSTVGELDIGTGTIVFNDAGGLDTGGLANVSFNPEGAQTMNIELDFSSLTQYGDESGVVTYQNGHTSGVFEGSSIDANGFLIANYSNGMSKQLAKIAMARFDNPAGLIKAGDSLFESSSNSGIAQIGSAGIKGIGYLIPGALEMSNVDIAKEFTQMIITQRGLQANSRVITTSDEIFQELVNLKR